MAGEQVNSFRPKKLNHILKTLIFASITFYLLGVLILYAPHPAFYALGLFVYPFLAATLRSLHSLTFHPYFRLSMEGIELRYWEPRPPWLVLRPLRPAVQDFVRWGEYKGCSTFTHTMNSIPTIQALVIETDRGEHFIGWDVFRGRVRTLQSRVFDFIEERFYQQEREEARVREFCRLRFHTPISIRSGGVWLYLAILGVGLVSLPLAIVYNSALGEGLFSVLLLVSVGLCLGGIERLGTWLSRRSSWVLQLRPDGFALGSSDSNLRLIPWDHLMAVRRITEAKEQDPKRSLKTTSLSVRVRGGESLLLYPIYSCPLEDIQELLDPPVAKVKEAWRHMETGMDVESAAYEVELPLVREIQL